MIPDDEHPIERYVIENGPTRESELPFEVTKTDQTERLRRFINPYGEASHPRDTDTEDAVWYHAVENADRNVVREYIDANEKLQTAPVEHVLERIEETDPAFVRAARVVIEEYPGIKTVGEIMTLREDRSGGRTSLDQEPCPLCETDLEGLALAFHLVDCPHWGGKEQ